MSQEDILDKNMACRKIIKKFLNSSEGELVYEWLSGQYVEHTALCKTTEQTYYRLGQKEFVQDLLAHKDFNFDQPQNGVIHE